MHQMEVELERAALETNKRKEVMLERDKAVKMLESLEETDRDAYRYFQAWGEQKQLDELAVFKDFRDNKITGSD